LPTCAYAVFKDRARSLKTRQQAHVIARLHLTWLLLPAVAGRRSSLERR